MNNVLFVNFLDLFNKQAQYLVPRWQRRYSWKKSTILQLVQDLEDISLETKDNVNHFGGTIITYSISPPSPVAPDIYHVVDGQQRLTTISILLNCIAEELEQTQVSTQISPEYIRSAYLINHNVSSRSLKLSLQDDDDEEYRRILEGNPKGEGKVTDALNILRDEVAKRGPEPLWEGLRKFKVILFPCEKFDDPQQIFESINATGVPLIEGEKVKNWLLMGMDDETQERVYQNHWRRLENCLDAVSEQKRIDTFLRDFLRWKTGKNDGERRTYVKLRRWWGEKNRAQLCEILADLAELYGKITGTNGQHKNKAVSAQLEYLRCLRIDVHRPFTLRLLYDASNPDLRGATEEEVVRVLNALGIWLTRLYLSENSTSGLNTDIIHFAHHNIHQPTISYSEYWIDKIKKIRKSKTAVPNEEEIKAGIRSRNAYRGAASDSSKAILWEINSNMGKQARPPIDDLSLEHIMPQNLNKEWEKYLGPNAKEIHRDFVNSLANLTLVGKKFNPQISDKIYAKKCKDYTNSGVTITRNLPRDYKSWREENIEERVNELTKLVLERWPWENITRAKARWRIGRNEWRNEKRYTDLLLSVISDLLTISPERNSSLLLGDNPNKNIFLKDMEPHRQRPDLPFRKIPNHGQYVVNVHFSGKGIFSLCQDMVKRCNGTIEIEIFKEYRDGQEIWESVELRPLPTQVSPRWRINQGNWKEEKSFSDTLLNVISTLLSLNPERNGTLLLGNRRTKDLFHADTVRSLPWAEKHRPIPDHSQFIVYPYHSGESAFEICRDMGERCGVIVEIENFTPFDNRSTHRWRINGGEWRREKTYSAILVNLVAELLDQAPLRNPLKLSGDSVTTDLLPSHFSPEDPERFHKIPNYNNYMIYVDPNPTNLIKQCKKLASRCGVIFEVKSERTQS